MALPWLPVSAETGYLYILYAFRWSFAHRHKTLCVGSVAFPCYFKPTWRFTTQMGDNTMLWLSWWIYEFNNRINSRKVRVHTYPGWKNPICSSWLHLLQGWSFVFWTGWAPLSCCMVLFLQWRVQDLHWILEMSRVTFLVWPVCVFLVYRNSLTAMVIWCLWMMHWLVLLFLRCLACCLPWLTGFLPEGDGVPDVLVYL